MFYYYLLLFYPYIIYPFKSSHKGGYMAYKKMKKNLGFSDFALAGSLKHNSSLKLMENLNRALNWDRIESVLMSHYTFAQAVKALMPTRLCCF